VEHPRRRPLRRARDSLLARAVPAIPSRSHARGSGGSTDRGRRKGNRGYDRRARLGGERREKKGPAVGWAAVMGRLRLEKLGRADGQGERAAMV
jgi:hypothetical protein